MVLEFEKEELEKYQKKYVGENRFEKENLIWQQTL